MHWEWGGSTGNNGYHSTSARKSLTSSPHSDNSVYPYKSLVTPMQPTQYWCSERAGSLPWKCACRNDPFKRHLLLPQPLSHSVAWDQAASRLHPILPPTVAGWLFLSLVVMLLFIETLRRLCFLFVLCFSLNFVWLQEEMNETSVIYAICPVLSRSSPFTFTRSFSTSEFSFRFHVVFI